LRVEAHVCLKRAVVSLASGHSNKLDKDAEQKKYENNRRQLIRARAANPGTAMRAHLGTFRHGLIAFFARYQLRWSFHRF
jgi:hypothetical protein